MPKEAYSTLQATAGVLFGLKSQAKAAPPDRRIPVRQIRAIRAHDTAAFLVRADDPQHWRAVGSVCQTGDPPSTVGRIVRPLPLQFDSRVLRLMLLNQGIENA